MNERQEVLMVQEGSGPLKGKGALLIALQHTLYDNRAILQPFLGLALLQGVRDSDVNNAYPASHAQACFECI